MASNRRTSSPSASALDSAPVASIEGVPPDRRGAGESSVPERHPLLTLHRLRAGQWGSVAPSLNRGPFASMRTDALLHAAADAEAVLWMVAEVAGLLGTDESDRINAEDERDVVLGGSTRLNLLAGIEAVARLAANGLSDWHSSAQGECLRAESRGTGDGASVSSDRGVSR